MGGGAGLEQHTTNMATPLHSLFAPPRVHQVTTPEPEASPAPGAAALPPVLPSLFRRTDLPGYDAGCYETKQVFVASKDGTKVRDRCGQGGGGRGGARPAAPYFRPSIRHRKERPSHPGP